MKLTNVIAILFLTATLAFPQAAVHYGLSQTACKLTHTSQAPGLGGPVSCFSTPTLDITGTSTNPMTVGMLLVVQYTDVAGNPGTTTMAVFTHGVSEDFVASMPFPSGSVVVRVTATELLSGDVATE